MTRGPAERGGGSSSCTEPWRRMPVLVTNSSWLLEVENRSTLTSDWKGTEVQKLWSTSFSMATNSPLETKRVKPS